MSCADVTSAVSDVVVACAAVAATITAWRGLTTWRDQLRGTVEYELARRVLKGVYYVRDAVARVRDPFMFAAEMPEPPVEKMASMSREQSRFHGISEAYQARWKQVIEARRNLDADLLEAEVVWGRDLKTRVDAVRKLEHELFIAVRHHLQLQNPDERIETREAVEKISRKLRDVLYEGGDGETDPFADDYSGSVAEVENYLRPHLRRP